jgi:hypothetical protein
MLANVAHGSKGDLAAPICDVRFAPNSDLKKDIAVGSVQGHEPKSNAIAARRISIH